MHRRSTKRLHQIRLEGQIAWTCESFRFQRAPNSENGWHVYELRRSGWHRLHARVGGPLSLANCRELVCV